MCEDVFENMVSTEVYVWERIVMDAKRRGHVGMCLITWCVGTVEENPQEQLPMPPKLSLSTQTIHYFHFPLLLRSQIVFSESW